MDNTDYFSTPELSKAQTEAETAGTTAGAYQSAAALLPQKLREAVMSKVDYNKDIIEQKNKAQAEYFAAPSEARAKYADPTSANYIFNPFQAEKLVNEERTQAYAPYATLTDILGQRMGSLADIIGAGTQSFGAAVQAAANEAQNALQRFQNLFGLAQAKQGQANWQKQFDLEQYKAKNPSGGSGGVAGLGDIIDAWAKLNDLENNRTGTTKEAMPNYSPSKGIGTTSPGGEWIYTGSGTTGWEELANYELAD